MPGDADGPRDAPGGRRPADDVPGYRALLEAAAPWRAVFENSAIGVALTDLEGRFCSVNPAYEKMLGYTEQELQALTFLDLTHEDHRDFNWALVTELLAGKRERFQIDKQYRRKDGSVIWVRNTASLVPGDSVLEVTDKRVAVTSGEYQGVRRMTLTYPELQRTRRLLWVSRM